MNFKEDVFAKVITYITVAVLLGAMLVEAFVIYTERSEKKEIAGRLVSARASVSSLTKEKAELEAHNTELQEFKSKWENLVILADNEFCQELREELFRRPEVIPEEAIEASLKAELEEGQGPEEEKAGSEEQTEDGPLAAFVFPSSEDKEWFLPLNLGNKPSVEYLFYARAVDVERDRCIDLLYEVPVDGADDSPLLDEDGEIIWNCMAYDAGLGWTLITEEEE